jgi:CRP/FNR family transcriptional regulator
MLPEAALDTLLSGAEPTSYGQSDVIARPFSPMRPSIVLTGRVRFYVEAWDGRQATLGYQGRGGSLGMPHLFARDIPIGAQAVTESTLLLLDRTVLERLMASDMKVGLAVMSVLSSRLGTATRQLRHFAFGSARQRLAGQLLQLSQSNGAGRKVVPLTQQELADTVGTVREHVSRLLRDFREAGLVVTSRSWVEIVDEDGLQAESRIG